MKVFKLTPQVMNGKYRRAIGQWTTTMFRGVFATVLVIFNAICHLYISALILKLFVFFKF